VGNVKIRYYVTRKAWPGSTARWGYWSPCLKRKNPKTSESEPTLMAKLGFSQIRCGEDGPAAWRIAEQWNARWDEALAKHRRGDAVGDPAKMEPIYPVGSMGEGFARYRGTKSWSEDKKPRTREDWERGWKHIAPVFGDVAPRTVTFEEIDGFYHKLRETIGIRESKRVMKIWRILWKTLARMQVPTAPNGETYCKVDADPSLAMRVKDPKARNAFWYEGEAVRVAKQAWRQGFRGLAAALAVAWDTMMSPIDVVSLTLAQLEDDGQGPMFMVARAKTGKPAIGTLSRRTQKVLDAYLKSLPFTLHPDTPIFHTRGTQPGSVGRPRPPVPYTRPMLGEDFRTVRAAILPGERRQIADFRRSGAIEATAGEVQPGALASKMANTIDDSKQLQATYTPHTAQLVRLADQHRIPGRDRLRGAKNRNGAGSNS
jgi:hypothetical protein